MMTRKTDGKDVLLNRDAFLLSMSEVQGIPLDEKRVRLALTAQNRYLVSLLSLIHI